MWKSLRLHVWGLSRCLKKKKLCIFFYSLYACSCCFSCTGFVCNCLLLDLETYFLFTHPSSMSRCWKKRLKHRLNLVGTNWIKKNMKTWLIHSLFALVLLHHAKCCQRATSELSCLFSGARSAGKNMLSPNPTVHKPKSFLSSLHMYCNPSISCGEICTITAKVSQIQWKWGWWVRLTLVLLVAVVLVP